MHQQRLQQLTRPIFFVASPITTNASYSVPFVSGTNANEALQSSSALVFNPNTIRFGSNTLLFVGQTYLTTVAGNAQAIGLNGGNISLATTPSFNDVNHGL